MSLSHVCLCLDPFLLVASFLPGYSLWSCSQSLDGTGCGHSVGPVGGWRRSGLEAEPLPLPARPGRGPRQAGGEVQALPDHPSFPSFITFRSCAYLDRKHTIFGR